MLRFTLRTIGFLSLAAAFAALVVDGSRSIAGGRLMMYSFGDAASWLGGARVGEVLAAMPGWPATVRALAGVALAVPAWIAAGALGLAALLLGRTPSAHVGFRGGRS